MSTSERSELRFRARHHIHPERRQETIVEVYRGGKLVGTIYGSREGVHIVTNLALLNRPFSFVVEGGEKGPMPSWVFPLLAEGDPCPWCGRVKAIPGGDAAGCPVCSPSS
jgi:hypothetical protein